MGASLVIIWILGLLSAIAVGIYRRKKGAGIISDLIVLICDMVTGGTLLAGYFYESFYRQDPAMEWMNSFMLSMCMIVMLIGIPAALILLVGCAIAAAGTSKNPIAMYVVCGVMLLVSAYGWFNIIKQNDETLIIQTYVEEEVIQEREVAYFSHIPNTVIQQDTSGKVFGLTLFGNGIVYGSIDTDFVRSDELTYWYVNEEGNSCIDYAPAKKTSIVPIAENEKPYMKVVKYIEWQNIEDEKSGEKVTKKTGETWIMYYFYIPEGYTQ